jgi:hypothetical protein
MRWCRRAQPLDQITRLRRRCHSEPTPHAFGQRTVGEHGAGAIAGPVESLDQTPVGLFIEPVALHLPARELLAEIGDCRARYPTRETLAASSKSWRSAGSARVKSIGVVAEVQLAADRGFGRFGAGHACPVVGA